MKYRHNSLSFRVRMALYSSRQSLKQIGAAIILGVAGGLVVYGIGWLAFLWGAR